MLPHSGGFLGRKGSRMRLPNPAFYCGLFCILEIRIGQKTTEISQTLAVEAVIGEPVSGPHISLLHGKMQGISAEPAPKAGMRRRLPNHKLNG